MEKQDFERAKCDKYDYMIAASCGVMAGMVDAFFVGAPGQSVLQGAVDKGADELVKKAAQTFWKFDKRAEKNKKMPATLEQCISYLEQAFPVPYDARYAKDLVVEDGILEHMAPQNHHLYSLGHSTDIIGLVFSIIDQYTDTASFIDNGQVIRVRAKKKSGAVPYLQGTTTVSRLFCGFVNWIGHIISDLAGSSSTRRKGNRGTGVSIPFYELFLFCDFANFDGKTIADIAVKAFEEGYDARFAATMAIPVVLNDLFIRLLWAIKKHFYAIRPWAECIPVNKHDDLRVMVLVGTGALCAVDGIDAFVRSGGEPVAFVMRINLVGWGKLTMMALKELVIRYNYAIDDIAKPYVLVEETVREYLAELEKIDAEAFRRETDAFNRMCSFMENASTEEELNLILKTSMKKMGFELPYEGSFDDHMSDKTAHLVFS